MLYLDMSVTVQSVKKMNERLLIVVNYCFSNAPLQSTKIEGAVRDVLFRTAYCSLAPAATHLVGILRNNVSTKLRQVGRTDGCENALRYNGQTSNERRSARDNF